MQNVKIIVVYCLCVVWICWGITLGLTYSIGVCMYDTNV